VPERTRIPERGRDPEELLAHMQELQGGDLDWRGGRVWSLVYHVSEAHTEVLTRAHNLFFSENLLNPLAFKSLKRLEHEVVQMTAAMLHGPEAAVGSLTSGGTESLLLAVKAYRDLARRKRPWVLRPNMVVPESIHVSFDKAAHYFGVTARYAPVGADHRADLRAMRRLTDRNTILLAASAPQYPQGVMDPIEELGAFAHKKGLPLHVDACLGGYMLPWLERLGHAIPRWDFRVPGVTSVSADLHKYGYAPKGVSCLVYRDMRYMRNQFFISTDWSGGIYASPTMAGSRPGGPVAAAWASLVALGEAGFVDLARKALEVTARLRAGIEAIDGLMILGDPPATVFAWGSSDPAIDVYAVADQMAQRGWTLDRQQRPPSVHVTVNAHNAPVVDRYLEDLRASVDEVRAHPELKREGEAAMYGLIARVPLRGMVKRNIGRMMEDLYGPSGAQPDFEAADAPGMGLVNLVERARGAVDKVRRRGR
jgi:glutamate/tyrosine decarboxylase-like PLP-dependent enzyme